MTAIAFDRVSLDYGRRRILSDVSFAIPDGAFVGVLGPNGAGKTTAMRAVLGLVAPTSGRIEVLGAAPKRGNPAIGYMPQARRTPSTVPLSGFQLVLGAVTGRRWGWPVARAEDKATAWEALERVGAAEIARRPITELSGGERQRVLIAQTLIGHPKLLLLDEPLISLDPPNQRAIVELTARIGRELGIAVLFCAHEVNPLIGALDQVLYLGNGQAALGTVDEVISTPVLSRIYGAPINVIRLGGRIFVVAEDVEAGGHLHEHVHVRAV